MIYHNIISGVTFTITSENLIYNNYFNNSVNVLEGGAIINKWNISKTDGPNIMGGPYIGGNYWNDYTGLDLDGDELGDTDIPYDCNGNIKTGGDYLPIVSNLTEWFPCSMQGEINGIAGKEYEYIIDAIDPFGGNVYYYIEWDDGTVEDWFGPYPSGELITVKHKWIEQGDYTVRGKAKNTKEIESDWAVLYVTMPRYKPVDFNFNPLIWLFERFPNLFPILTLLLQRLGLQ